jgi:fucose permease
MHRRSIFIGLLLLLLGSYIDNARGPLMPALTRNLGLGYTEVSWMLVAGFIAAIACTFGMLPLTSRYSDRRLAGWAVAAGLGASLFALAVTGFWSLLALGALLGLAVSGLGSVSNLIVLQNTSAEYKARMMCFLHSMYGVGSFLAPGVVGWTVGKGLRWQVSLLVAAPLLALAWLGTRSLGTEIHGAVSGARRKLDASQWLVVAMVAFYVGGEVLISTWMMTYLVEAKGMTVVEAAPYATAFFVAMGVTRLLCVFALRPAFETPVLVGSLAVGMGAFLLGRVGPPWALSLSGLFGPFFPLIIARLGKAFPVQARSITLVIIGVMQVTLAFLHLGVGWLTDGVGIGTAYWMPLGLLGASLFTLIIYIPRERAVVS